MDASRSPRPGDVRLLGNALWWRSAGGDGRIVPPELWRARGDDVAWLAPTAPESAEPRVWEVVYAPLAARDLVMAVRVLKVTTARKGIVLRGATAEGDEVTLDSAR